MSALVGKAEVLKTRCRSPVLTDVDKVCDWQPGSPIEFVTVDLFLFVRIEPLSPDKLHDTLPVCTENLNPNV